MNKRMSCGSVSRVIASFGLGITGLMSAAPGFAGSAATQMILPSQTSYNVSPGDDVEFTVRYTASSPASTTGLGVILYFDSSKLTLLGLSNIYSNSKISDDVSADSSNGDGDSSTDKRVNVAWTSFSGGWPGTSGDTDLYTIAFTATQSFSSDTTINFTGDASAGHTFGATPVSIAYKDTIAPSITAPSSLSVEATAPNTAVATATLGTPSVSDNLDTSPSVSYAPQGPYSVGQHTITWTATDSANNSATDTQILTITDTVAPQITAPQNISTPATGSTTPVALGTPSVSDTADSAPTVTANKASPFALGTHTITWTATDASGNANTATQTVTITSPGAPTLSAPASITQEATGATTPVTLPSVTGNDVIDGQLTATADKASPFAVGAHTITWSVTNSQNISSTATQTITITDTTAPQITTPADQTVAATGASTAVDVGTATATDLVDGSVTVTSDATATYPVGTHTITWTATDSSNNTGTATQTIIVSDGQGPTITAPDDITVEATGPATAVTLGSATASDTVDGALTATPDQQGPFSVGVHSIVWSVTDSAGNTATATQTVTISDSGAPEITVNAETLALNASGVLTPIPRTGVTASDPVDTNPVVTVFTVVDGAETEVPTAGLPSGRHQLLWKATDSAGNTNSASQALEITPQVNFSTTQSASAGDQVTVTATLSGAALEYPVIIPYSIDTQASTVNASDHNASRGSITIASGASGSFSFTVAANPQLNGSGKGNLIFNMGTPDNAVAGATTSHRVIISASNIPPVVTLKMTQAGERITTVAKDAGKVTVQAQATDSPSQTLSYDWGQTDSGLTDLTTDAKDETFELDPANLTVGNSYKVAITVSDNGSPLKQTSVAIRFEVIGGNSTITDSDGDGIVDSEDQIPEPNRLPAVSGATFVMESEAGTKLKLGETARLQKQPSASIDPDKIPAIPSQYKDAGLSIYDFEITGVAQGESTLIVIPQKTAIPAEAVYLKYNGQSWLAFVQDNNNVLYSAKGNANGNCPPVGSSEYVEGLKAGDFCLQLKIQDGGSNDTDGSVNGQIADPGTVVGPKADDQQEEETPATSTNPSSGGGGSMPWYLMPLLFGLGLVRRGLFKKK